MKKIVIIAILIGLIGRTNQTKAQSAGAVAGVAAATIVGAAIIGGLVIEQVKEQMELEGTEYILSHHPEITNFQLSVLDFEDTKISDLYNTSCVSFGVMIFDSNTGAYKENKVLLMFSSKDWVNQYGLDFTKVKFDLLSKNEWGNILFNYINLASAVKITDSNAIPVYKPLEGSSVNKEVMKIESIETPIEYFEKTNITTTVAYSRLSPKGLDYSFIEPKQKTRKTAIAVPFNSISGDRYLVKDFSSEYRIVYNEGSLIFYIKDVGELCVMRRRTVNRIQSFLQ